MKILDPSQCLPIFALENMASRFMKPHVGN